MTTNFCFRKWLGIRHLEKPIKKVEKRLLIFTMFLKIRRLTC